MMKKNTKDDLAEQYRRLIFVDKKLKQIEAAIGRMTNPFGNYESDFKKKLKPLN